MLSSLSPFACQTPACKALIRSPVPVALQPTRARPLLLGPAFRPFGKDCSAAARRSTKIKSRSSEGQLPDYLGGTPSVGRSASAPEDAPAFTRDPHNEAAVAYRAMMEGTLPRAVLDKTVRATTAFDLCLRDVLSVDTYSPKQHAAAGRALVALWTHKGVQSGVIDRKVPDGLLKVITLTTSPSGFAAAVEALVHLAESPTYKDMPDHLPAVLARCLEILEEAGAALRHSAAATAAKPAPAADTDAAAPPAAPDDITRVINTAAAGASNHSPSVFPSEEATGALAVAAAGALRHATLLQLASPEQLLQAEGALGRCLAAGITAPELLAALKDVLKRCGGETLTAAASAVLGSGAVGPLAAVVASSAGGHVPPHAVVEAGRGEMVRTDDAADSSPPALSPARAGDLVVCLTSPAAQSAFFILTEALIHAAQSPTVPSLPAASSSSAAVSSALVPLLQLEDPGEASRALHALLLLGQYGNSDPADGVTAVVKGHGATDRLWRAMECITPESQAPLPPSQVSLVTGLLRLSTALLEAGWVDVPNLERSAPGCVKLVWALLEGEAATISSGGTPHLPAGLTDAAIGLASHLFDWLVGQPEECWPDHRTVTAACTAIRPRVLDACRAGGAQAVGHMRCLTKGLLLAHARAAPGDKTVDGFITDLNGRCWGLYTSSSSTRMEARGAFLQMAAVAAAYRCAFESPSVHGLVFNQASWPLVTAPLDAAALTPHDSPLEQLALLTSILNMALGCFQGAEGVLVGPQAQSLLGIAPLRKGGAGFSASSLEAKTHGGNVPFRRVLSVAVSCMQRLAGEVLQGGQAVGGSSGGVQLSSRAAEVVAAALQVAGNAVALMARVGDVVKETAGGVKKGRLVTIKPVGVRSARILQFGHHGGWTDPMADMLGKGGVVERVNENGGVLVRMVDGSGSLWWDPLLVVPVEKGSPVAVKTMPVDAARSAQEGHGGWSDSMAGMLGQMGVVVGFDADGTVVIKMAGGRVRWNPLLLVPMGKGSPVAIKTMPVDVAKTIQSDNKVSWSDSMAGMLGQMGLVERVGMDGTIVVKVADGSGSQSWTPLLVVPVEEGTRVRIRDMTVEEAKKAQEGDGRDHGGWTDSRAKCLGKTGVVTYTWSDGDLTVKMDDGSGEYCWNPVCVTLQ